MTNFESKYKQFKTDLKTACMYENMEYYNEIADILESVKLSIEEKQKHVHEDDDNTNTVLEDVICSIMDAMNRLEDLQFYDGDRNRLG